MDNRAFLRLFLFFGIILGTAYLCSGQSRCRERIQDLRDRREGLRQKFIVMWNALKEMNETDWNDIEKQDRLAIISESITQISRLKTNVENFKSRLDDLCQRCTWENCPNFEIKLERRLNGLDRAIDKLNEYKESVETESDNLGGLFLLSPVSAPGDYLGPLNSFP